MTMLFHKQRLKLIETNFYIFFLYIFVTSITLVFKSSEYSEDQSLMQDRDILWWKEVNILSWELNVMGDRT